MPATSKNILSNSFKGFESLFTQWRMFAKMTFIIIFALVVLHILILTLLLKLNPDVFLNGFSGNDLCIFRTNSIMIIRYKIIPISSEFTFPYSCDGPKVIVDYNRFRSAFKQYYDCKLLPIFMSNFIRIPLFTGQIYWIHLFIIIYLSKKHRDSTKDSFLRGKVMIRDVDYFKMLLKYNDGFKININDWIFVPDSIMSKHNFIIGATGSGKSQLANRIIEQLIQHLQSF